MGYTEQKYWLSPHVHVCVTDDYAVLLDLRRDKYIGIGREHLPALAASVVGWPTTVQSEVEPSAPAKALLCKMLSTGALTTNPFCEPAPAIRVTSAAEADPARKAELEQIAALPELAESVAMLQATRTTIWW